MEAAARLAMTSHLAGGDEARRDAAKLLLGHRIARTPFPGFPPECEPISPDDGYAIQDLLSQLLDEAGRGPTAGYKIGCTTAVMQRYLDIDQPAAGAVLAPTVQHDAGTIQLDTFVRVGVECEIAVRLGSDLPPEGAPYQAAELAPAIGATHAAIEIVDDRYVNWRSLSAAALVADDFFGAGCILGPAIVGCDVAELKDAHARLLVNDAEIGSGNGAEILGDPLLALVWLANTLARRGRGLRAGEIVLLGSLVQTHWVEATDDLIVVEHSSLGSVEARIRA
jgi:2-keto-4-pentenoate hydratase